MRPLALIFVVIALTVRALVPVGWMPSEERAFALTVCTGTDTQTIWMDSKGALHREDPGKSSSIDHAPCAFAGAMAAADLPTARTELAPVPARRVALPSTPREVHIGKGLAAPPPPATGPPSLV